ncbi:hypothetical protein PR048_004581 [Dryococelus australis]|uniref:Uncharacterized protein n=1 Tax=Dryococelus australis TaxID=614101 RepID=A0ABQ9I5U5_9NEOP|nr:hypothetical protein PR048_004581 [Dryococelus australis]
MLGQNSSVSSVEDVASTIPATMYASKNVRLYELRTFVTIHAGPKRQQPRGHDPHNLGNTAPKVQILIAWFATTTQPPPHELLRSRTDSQNELNAGFIPGALRNDSWMTLAGGARGAFTPADKLGVNSTKVSQGRAMAGQESSMESGTQAIGCPRVYTTLARVISPTAFMRKAVNKRASYGCTACNQPTYHFPVAKFNTVVYFSLIVMMGLPGYHVLLLPQLLQLPLVRKYLRAVYGMFAAHVCGGRLSHAVNLVLREANILVFCACLNIDSSITNIVQLSKSHDQHWRISMWSSASVKERGKREIPDKTRQPVASFAMVGGEQSNRSDTTAPRIKTTLEVYKHIETFGYIDRVATSNATHIVFYSDIQSAGTWRMAATQARMRTLPPQSPSTSLIVFMHNDAKSIFLSGLGSSIKSQETIPATSLPLQYSCYSMVTLIAKSYAPSQCPSMRFEVNYRIEPNLVDSRQWADQKWPALKYTTEGPTVVVVFVRCPCLRCDGVSEILFVWVLYSVGVVSLVRYNYLVRVSNANLGTAIRHALLPAPGVPITHRATLLRDHISRLQTHGGLHRSQGHPHLHRQSSSRTGSEHHYFSAVVSPQLTVETRAQPWWRQFGLNRRWFERNIRYAARSERGAFPRQGLVKSAGSNPRPSQAYNRIANGPAGLNSRELDGEVGPIRRLKVEGRAVGPRDVTGGTVQRLRHAESIRQARQLTAV